MWLKNTQAKCVKRHTDTIQNKGKNCYKLHHTSHCRNMSPLFHRPMNIGLKKFISWYCLTEGTLEKSQRWHLLTVKPILKLSAFVSTGTTVESCWGGGKARYSCAEPFHCHFQEKGRCCARFEFLRVCTAKIRWSLKECWCNDKALQWMWHWMSTGTSKHMLGGGA